MWFIFALIATLGWGTADLFYKKGSESKDRYSHLKTAVWVGLIMGIVSLCLIPFSESVRADGFSVSALLTNSVKYFPASLSYIISMVIGYAGLRYLELSIISPVQNASGALSVVVMTVYFMSTGRFSSIGEAFSTMDLIGTALIVAGVIALAAVEAKQDSDTEIKAEKKYRKGALALIFPILYCVFDTLGTAADGIILDEESSLGLGEIDVLVIYGITFLLAGMGCWLFMLIKCKEIYNPFSKSEKSNATAACCEEFGQIFYVYAMTRNPVLAAPMIASYCIISVILSRIVIKEKLNARKYACVFTVIAGIVLLGISEGLSER